MTLFGFDDHDGVYTRPETISMMAEVGAKLVRFHALWHHIESTPGVYDFSKLDAVIGKLRINGIDPIVNVTGFPGWACEVSNEWPVRNDDPPFPWHPGPLTHDGFKTFQNFISVMANRYKGKVHYYEILNEPDLNDPVSLNFYMGFRGPNGMADTDYYVDLLQKAYVTIKGIDPSAKILIGGLLAEPQYADMMFLENVIGSGGTSFFDILSLHAYKPFIEVNWKGNLLEKISWIRGQSYSIKPVWITESGVWSTNMHGGQVMPPGNYPETEQSQANYLKELFLLSKSDPDIQSVLWFRFYDREDNTPDGYRGIVRKDLTHKPSYYAFRAFKEDDPPNQEIIMKVEVDLKIDGIAHGHIEKEIEGPTPPPPPPPPVMRWRCTGSPDYQCVEDQNGPYASLIECQTACKPPVPPPPSTYPKLNKIASGSGDWYGNSFDTYAEGQVKNYVLPLGEVYPGKNIRRLQVLSTALMDGQGNVDISLISPDGNWSRMSNGAFADETINAIAQAYPYNVNYPAQYLPSGYWTLRIEAKVHSQIKIWWKCY